MVALEGGGGEPGVGGGQIPLCAAAPGVHGTEHEAGAGVALQGGFLVPGEGEALIERDVFAVCIEVG